MVINKGRQIQFINGIQGVAAGANASINLDVNKRYHRNVLQTVGVNYTGGTALATTKITGGGANNLTVTPTIVNGVVTAVAVVAGGTGYTTGDTVTITDATGTGFVGTVTAAAGVVSAVAVTVGGTPSPISPVSALSYVRQVVNGVVIRDLLPASLMKVLNCNGIFPALGELPLNYTEPNFRINQLSEITSFDMFGQSTFTLQVGFLSTVVQPGLNAIMEFDNERNVRPGPSGAVPFLQPVSQHEFTFNLVAGLNKINTIPFDFPIRRMFFVGSVPGNLSQIEVYQDGNKALESSYAFQRQLYEPYGFEFGKPSFLTQNYATTNALKAAYNPFSFVDGAFISDPDQRLTKALTCENSLVLRVTSAVAQALTVIVESLPGQYAA